MGWARDKGSGSLSLGGWARDKGSGSLTGGGGEVGCTQGGQETKAVVVSLGGVHGVGKRQGEW